MSLPSLSLRWHRSPNLRGVVTILGVLPLAGGLQTALLVVGIVLTAALPVTATVVTGKLVGAIPGAARGGIAAPAGQAALALLALAAGLIVLSRLLAPFLTALANILGRRVDRVLQERLLAAVNRPVGIAHLEDPAILDLIQSAQGMGADGRRPGMAVSALATLLPSWLQALGSALLLAAFHWWLALAWLVSWPLIVAALQGEYLRVGRAGYGAAGATRRAEYYCNLALTPGPAKELRLWGILDFVIERFANAWLAAIRPIWEARRPGRRVVWLTSGAVVALNAVSFGLLAWAATHGALPLGALAVYTQATLGVNSFRAFDDANANLALAVVTIPPLIELEQRLADARSLLATVSLPPAAPHSAVRFAAVRFRYAGRPEEALAGLDLALPAGRSVAIVGANGAGKTTLLKLLCRLYEPTAGHITVDGVDLADVNATVWRRQVAAIFQDFSQYHLTARDNVALGAPALGHDQPRLRQAAAKAGALELIEALPQGWETVLSRQYAGGVDLSGGQWQRIALARALFAVEAGARLLILDEPTASLDVRAEAELYDRFLEITAGLTTILISHRFSTVRRADWIVVLAGGVVAEQGTHEDLMAQGGQYAAMFALQAERFGAAEATPARTGG